MISREKCIELCRENGLDWHKGFVVSNNDNRYEDLINRAYAEGQKDMRERAVNCIAGSDDQLMSEYHQERINSLESK